LLLTSMKNNDLKAVKVLAYTHGVDIPESEKTQWIETLKLKKQQYILDMSFSLPKGNALNATRVVLQIRTHQLHQAIRDNNFKAVDDFGSTYGIATSSPQGCSHDALRVACSHGRVEIFKLLVEKYGALKGDRRQCVTELSYLAVGNGQVEMWSVLVNEYEAQF